MSNFSVADNQIKWTI